MSKTQKECRKIEVTGGELRAIKDESGKRFIEGLAARYNHRSKLLYGEFYEILEPGAFTDVMQKDLNVVYTRDHNFSFVVARTKTRNKPTLQLWEDEEGLHFRAEIPDGVSYAEDLYKLVERGDYFENSFIFMVAEDGVKWEELADSENENKRIYLRRIFKIAELFDVSTVLNGAYDTTDVNVSKRALSELESFKNAAEQKPDNDLFLRRLKIAEITR